MSNKVVYLWVRASHPHNSIFIQVQLVSIMLADKFDIVTEILHPEVHDVRNKLKQINESGNIIFWHYGGFDPYLLLLKNKLNIVFIYHNITPAIFFWNTQPLVALWSIIGNLQLTLLDNRTKWITMSSYNARELYKFGFTDISVCPNIIMVGNIEGKKKTEHISLLYVGRISPNKNCVFLLGEIEKVANHFKLPVELVVVGSVKPGCRHGEKFQKKYNELLAHSWLKVNWKKDVGKTELQVLYRQSWLYVSMSLHEGFGVPVCESIAHGTPAMYLECGGQESILDNIGMVPLIYKDKFAEYVVRLISKQEERDDLLNKQLKIVRKYLIPEIEKQIVKTYSNFINPTS